MPGMFHLSNILKFVIINENGENICSLHSILNKIFIPSVNLDGFATEHRTGLLRHFVQHKLSDVLFKLTAISLCSFVPSIRFLNKIFIPTVNLDGFATEHRTDLLRHFVLHKPSDVLFKLAAIERCSIVPSNLFLKLLIFIPAVNLDGSANEHRTGFLLHFVLYKLSDVLFKLTRDWALLNCSLRQFFWVLDYLLYTLDIPEQYSDRGGLIAVRI